MNIRSSSTNGSRPWGRCRTSGACPSSLSQINCNVGLRLTCASHRAASICSNLFCSVCGALCHREHCEHSHMTDVETHYWTASDGIQLAWREAGQGRPVILLHGLFSDSQMNWIKFGHAERIAAQGVRVIMPDLRAHGLSGKPHEHVHYPQLVLARDLVEVIEHLELSEYDLGGFSLGARTVIEAVIGG